MARANPSDLVLVRFRVFAGLSHRLDIVRHATKLIVSAATFFVIACLLLFCYGVPGVRAQGTWLPMQELFTPQDGWKDLGTTLVADRAGNVHLAWLHYALESLESQFYYARWDGETWTSPVDIVASDKPLGWPYLLVDAGGVLHLFWFTGTLMNHSSAWSLAADDPRAWTSLDPVAYCETGCSAPMDVKQDSEGVLHLVYTEREGNCLYVRSEDGGASWSHAVAISSVAEQTTAFLPRLSVAEDGRIHAAWTETQLPNGPTLRVMYAYSGDEGATWSSPRQFAGQFHADANLLAEGRSVVHLVWNGGVGAGGRYYAVSRDSGVTWSQSKQISSGVGQAGYPSIASDSVGRLHVLTGQGEYIIADGPAWSVPEPLAFYDPHGVEQSRLVVVRGNQLVAISPNGFAGIYVTACALDAPTEEVHLFARPASEPSVSVEPTREAPEPVTTRDMHAADLPQDTESVDSAPTPLLVSVAASLTVLAAVFLLRANKSR